VGRLQARWEVPKRLLEHDVVRDVVAGTADGRCRIVPSLHCIDVAAQVPAQVTSPGVFEQTSRIDGGVDDVFRGHVPFSDWFVAGVDARGCVAEIEIPRGVQDHGVEHLVHVAFEHHEGLGLGDRPGSVPLHESLDETLGFFCIGRDLLTYQLTLDRAEVLFRHDFGEQNAGSRAVRTVLQRNDRALVHIGFGRGCCCMHAISPKRTNLSSSRAHVLARLKSQKTTVLL